MNMKSLSLRCNAFPIDLGSDRKNRSLSFHKIDHPDEFAVIIAATLTRIIALKRQLQR